MDDPLGTALRVATWNVNSFRAHEAQVLRWVESNEPDVIGLQETMVADAAFPHRGFESLGYQVVTHGRGGRGGVALASRLPIDDYRCGTSGAVAPFDQPRVLSASVRRIRFHVMYAPNGRKVGSDEHRFKLAWFQFIGAVLAGDGVETTPTVAMGDLNIAPTDRDLWDPHHYRKRNLTSPAERDAFGSLLEAGLVDVVRQELGDAHGYSWWNRRGNFYESDRGWRLDHILVTADLAATCSGLVVDRAERETLGGSDHVPIRLDLAD